MKNIFLILFSFCIGLTNCKDESNTSCTKKKFDCYCCPQADTTVKPLPKPSIARVNIFLDISGSMDGYMPNSMPATKFQKIIPELLAKLESEYSNHVNFFSVYDSQNKMKKEDLKNARNEILHGTFNWTANTYLPVMLDSIVKGYLKDGAVNIFVSDCIYAPKKKDEKESDLASTDIYSVLKPFAKINFAASIFCLKSEFRDKNTNVESSPYYMVLTGKQENINAVENLMMKSFSTFSQSPQEIHFGQQYSNPFYTLLPYTETTGNFDATFECTSFNNAFVKIQEIDFAETNQMECWIGIDLNELPKYAQIINYLDSNMNLTPDKGKATKISIVTKENFISKVHPDDKAISDKCTHFVKIRITELNDEVSSLNISVKNKRPAWVNLTNHDDVDSKEENRQNTFGLNNIVSGMEQAYNMNSSTLFFKPITISLIKK